MGPDFSTLSPKELKRLAWITGLAAFLAVPVALTAASALGGDARIILAEGAVLIALLMVHLGLWLTRLVWVGKLPSDTAVPASPKAHFIAAMLLAVHVGLGLGGLVVLALLIVGLVAEFAVSVSGPALVYITLLMIIVRAAVGTVLNLGILLNSNARHGTPLDI